MRNIDESRRAMHKILVWREMARPLPDGGAGEREREGLEGHFAR